MIGLALVAGLLAGPAQPDPLATALAEAQAHAEAGRHAEAAEAWAEVVDLSPEPKHVFALARARRAAGHCRRALAAFDRFFALCPACPERAEAEPLAEEARIACRLAPPSPRTEEDDPWLWGAAATSGIGLLTAGIFGWLLLEDLEAENAADTPEELADARSAADRDAVIAQIGLGVALIGALAAMTLWAREDEAEAAEGAAIRIGPFGISGRF